MASASRYGPFLIPGFIALYFLISGQTRGSVINTFLLLVFAGTFTFFRLRSDEQMYKGIQKWMDARKAWYECYEQKSDIEACAGEGLDQPFKDKHIPGMSDKIAKLKALQKKD